MKFTPYWQRFGSDMTDKLLDTVWSSRSDNTIKTYVRELKHWIEWAEQRLFTVLPADEVHIVQYLLDRSQKTKSPASLQQVVAALRWWHKQCDLPDPTQGSATTALLQVQCRTLRSGLQRKQELSMKTLVDICTFLKVKKWGAEMAQLWTAYVTVSYAAFLRFAEARDMLWQDIEDTPEGLVITIPKAKNDQMREGKSVYLAETGTISCPVAAVKAWWHVSSFNRPENPVFTKTGNKMNYRMASMALKRLLQAVGQDPTQYGLHSLRAGGATQAARSGVDMDMIQRHGRWRSADSVHTYVNPASSVKFSVTQKMFQLGPSSTTNPSLGQKPYQHQQARSAANYEDRIRRLLDLS